MARIRLASEALAQVKEDSEAQVNVGKEEKFAHLFRILAEGYYRKAKQFVAQENLLVSPALIDFLNSVKNQEIQLLSLRSNAVWLSKSPEVVMALVTPAEVRRQKPEEQQKFLDAEVTTLLRVFYGQEFTVTLLKPTGPRDEKETTKKAGK